MALHLNPKDLKDRTLLRHLSGDTSQDTARNVQDGSGGTEYRKSGKSPRSAKTVPSKPPIDDRICAAGWQHRMVVTQDDGRSTVTVEHWYWRRDSEALGPFGSYEEARAAALAQVER